MFEFFNGLFQLLSGFLYAALLGVCVLIGFAILGLLTRRLMTKRRKLASHHGFLQVHETTDYDREPAIRTREACQATGKCDENAEAALPPSAQKPVAVLRFDGDLQATERKPFARLVDEVIANKERMSGVVVVVNSPGGSVAEYGRMFAEMERIRKAGIDLTAVVDEYAASGGQLAVLPANRIIAAPFAIVGSIGVVSEFMNFHEFLKSLRIQPLTLTAGERKRTLTPLGEVTEEKKEQYLAQLKAIHEQFKALVKKYRSEVDIEAVCTGEHWTAQQAFDRKLGLVDGIATSQEYLFQLNQSVDLVFVTEQVNPFEKGIFRLLARLIDFTLARLIDRLSSRI